MNPSIRSVFSYKLVEPQLKALKGLETRLVLDHIEDFKKAYGNILGIFNTEVNPTTIHTLIQFYDPPLRCLMFWDYQLASMLEEYSHILGVGIKDRAPFFSTKELPKFHLLSEAFQVTTF